MANEAQKQEKGPNALREEETLAFWEKNGIFKKSLEKEPSKGEFVFYDGPPFANGLPHYGHLIAGTIKDVIPRYKTMQGFRVPRRFGWDCHGLPVENFVEKEKNFRTKKDIVQYGIANFNAAARESVTRFVAEWKKIVPRFGRFVDMDNDYRTMDRGYTESVWWVFRELYGKGLVYEGFKPMHLCPHCETTLSNFEVSQGYKETEDVSAYVKFPLAADPTTFLLAWTTTPWTLPGNAALAVNADAVYVRVRLGEKGKSLSAIPRETSYILAKDRLAAVLKDYACEAIDEFKGAKLVGAAYRPPFPYYAKGKALSNRENGWKVYGAAFVTTADGTGIVHVAPAFGEDDYALSVKEKLPFIQHVGVDGKFLDEVTEFAGLSVKPKSDDPKGHQRADIEIVKYLDAHGALFAKETITHSYPHCWRCETPLLNYAASSWFVKVTALKDRLASENRKVRWVPQEMRDGRFGKWLLGARDWAISRSRFWGAPLPIWRCERCREAIGIASVSELSARTNRGNRYTLVRHGEAENNVRGVISSKAKHRDHLTEKGKEEIRAAGRALRGTDVRAIIASPFLRTRESAELIADAIGFPKEKIEYDDRLSEIATGSFDGKTWEEYNEFFKGAPDRFERKAPGGENWTEVKRRVTAFLYEIDARYKKEHIVVVGHDDPLFFMRAGAAGLSRAETIALPRKKNGQFFEVGEMKELSFSPLPHNEDFELDLHRPYIDEVALSCACGGEARRIPDVFDCWFESGAMPYGAAGYAGKPLPHFDPRGGMFRKPVGFPADFVAEGLDQTRGWFYAVLVLGVGLFGKAPYKAVIVNGTVLAEDGSKMSKRLKNYPDPTAVADRYGADALRYYLLSSGAMRAEDLRFSERGVEEVAKKFINRLANVLQFYLLYAEGRESAAPPPRAGQQNILDRWIAARFAEVLEETTGALERYELDRAARPLAEFVEDLSTWYLRRSRERFKRSGDEDGRAALGTVRTILLSFSRVLAPFMPFFAEHLYRTLQGEKESVHLDSWPAAAPAAPGDEALLREMKEVRRIVSLALEARASAGIKVRQPLAVLKILDLRSPIKGNAPLAELIKDEVNVKEVSFAPVLNADIELATEITPELREEGNVRELIRELQEMRKKGGFRVNDRVDLFVETSEGGRALIERHQAEIARAALLRSVTFGRVDVPQTVIDVLAYKFLLKK